MASIEKTGANTYKLTFEVSAEEFEKGIQAAFQKIGRRFNVPGFRKGKAPLKVIENYYGEAVFYEDAFDAVYDTVFPEAVKEHDLHPVDAPKLDIQEIGKGKDLKFTAEVTTMPVVELGQYKGIEVERAEYTLSDEEVDAELDRARERAARWLDIEEGAAEDGDRVVIDYEGKIDGVPFEGGKAEDQRADIGAKRFIPGFEEGIIGMKSGESRDITVTFPEDYSAEELKGKEAVFTIALKEIKRKELPELDDELAKDVSEFDTLAEYRESIREELTGRKKESADVLTRERAAQIAADNASVEIPDVMVQRQIDNMLRDMEWRLRMQGMDFEQYLEYTGSSLEALRESCKGDALYNVKLQLVLEAVRKAEKIEAYEEELGAEIAKMAERARKTAEEYQTGLSDEEREYIKDSLEVKKTVDLIYENAVLIDPKPEEKKDGAEADE